MKKNISILFLCLILFSSTFLDIFAQIKKRPAKILKNTITVKKMDILNSPYLETNLSITPDGKYLFFMSENPSSWSTKNYTPGRFDGDIWYSRKVGGTWQKPKNIGRTINTPQGEDEPNVSPDGQTVYFQSWKPDWRTTGGPYYKAELSGTNWKNPVGLSSGITEFFISLDPNSLGGLATDGATFSPDGKKFIIAFGKSYTDNMDLYMSQMDSRGNWSTLKKLPISTTYNERSPFLAADGKTLYFASNGYEGFGKLDIFKTTLNDDGSCGEVVNIGEPFNTKDDDYGFVLTATGDESYFVRNGDIYYADLKRSTEDIKPDPIVILNGIIRDSLTGKPIEAIVKVKDFNNNQEIGASRSNSNSGEYSVVLQKDKEYLQSISKKGYKDFSRTFSIPKEPEYKELKYDVNLIPIGDNIQAINEIPQIKNDTRTAKKDTVKLSKRDTAIIVNQKKDTTFPSKTPAQRTTSEEFKLSCLNKLYDYRNLSIGLTGSIPFSIGLNAEFDYRNFGLAIGVLHFPNIGQLDETKPAEEFKSANYSELLLSALTYHIPLNCELFPFIGFYGGLQFRHWKKDIGSPGNSDVESGTYTAKHYGLAIGLKFFITSELFLEGSLGLGRNSVHSQPSGDITKWENQALGWFGICYMFNLDK